MSITLEHGLPLEQRRQGGYERPLTDIVHREHEVVVAIELPGVKERDILVCFTYDGIEVWAHGRRNYYRYIALSHHHMQGTHATFRHGILELRIPVEVTHAVAP